MTLTDQLPSLRRTLPDPIAVDAWPEETRARVDDVLVGGLSLRAVAAVTGTPCVHAGAAVLPGTHGMPDADATASVVVAMVVALAPDAAGTAPAVVGCAGAAAVAASHAVVLDVDAGDAPLVWDEARLLGRISTARRTRRPVVHGGAVQGAAPLPHDLHPGDLLAIPCPGSVHVRSGVLERARPEPATWLASLR